LTLGNSIIEIGQSRPKCRQTFLILATRFEQAKIAHREIAGWISQKSLKPPELNFKKRSTNLDAFDAFDARASDKHAACKRESRVVRLSYGVRFVIIEGEYLRRCGAIAYCGREIIKRAELLS
jgi:hypothetical protein